MKKVETVKRAVLVGTALSPGQTHKKNDGTVVRTSWGEFTWQLAGKEGYLDARSHPARSRWDRHLGKGEASATSATEGKQISSDTSGGGAPEVGTMATVMEPTQSASKIYRRFHGTALLDPIRINRDAAKIAEKAVQHSSSLLG